MRTQAKHADHPGRPALRALLLALLPALLLAAGCTGTANNDAVPFDPATGHPAGFLSSHPALAMKGTAACAPCHGADLGGGTSRVSCAATSWNGMTCHAGGPGHGTQAWVDNVHFLRAKANLDSCRSCHGASLRGGAGTATSGPSCYSVSFGAFGACHAAGPDHLLTANWVVNDNAVPNTVSGHQAATFADNGASCRACHGATLAGGISNVSCSIAGRSGFACHARGPAFHPASWLDCTFGGQRDVNLNYLWHGDGAQNSLPICSNCHGVRTTSPKCINTCHFNDGGGRVPQPLITTWSHGLTNHHQTSITTDNGILAVCVNCHATHNRFGQKPVCHNCHPPFPGASGHGAGWLQSHAPAARSAGVAGLAGSCGTPGGPQTMTCHGSDLSGGNGPACRACHAGEGLDNTAQLSNCRTCHGNPPPGVPPLSQPAGYPNLAGAHAKHAALSGVACATCHTGAGMPPAPAVQTSLLHFDNVLQVAFAAGYNARSGILGYAAATRSCTATICHGGQPTPDWRRTPATLACTGCHKSSATAPLQYNDWSNVPFGEHTFHIGRFGTGNSCTICHDAAYLAVAANHYPNPKATTFRNPPASLRASLNYAPPGSSKSNCSTGGIPNPAGGTYSCH